MLKLRRCRPKVFLVRPSYTLNQWHRLVLYTESGLVMPDNNVIKNAIRLFVVGRKTGLFSCTPEGASVCIYSLIETAKANELEPYWYFKFLFENLPGAVTADEFKALMAQNVDKHLLKSNYTTPCQS